MRLLSSWRAESRAQWWTSAVEFVGGLLAAADYGDASIIAVGVEQRHGRVGKVAVVAGAAAATASGTTLTDDTTNPPRSGSCEKYRSQPMARAGIRFPALGSGGQVRHPGTAQVEHLAGLWCSHSRRRAATQRRCCARTWRVAANTVMSGAALPLFPSISSCA